MRWRNTCRCWANSQRSRRSTVDVLVPQAVEQVLEVPKIPSRDRILQCTVEQILDVPVLEKAEQLAEVPKIVSQDRIQQRTVEQTVDILVPQDVEEPAEFFKASSQDRVQQRFGGQIIQTPAISLAEKIVEVPVIQTQQKTQQGVNTYVQHVVDTVEVEKTHHPGENQPGDQAHRGSTAAVHRQGR